MIMGDQPLGPPHDPENEGSAVVNQRWGPYIAAPNRTLCRELKHSSMYSTQPGGFEHCCAGKKREGTKSALWPLLCQDLWVVL